MAHILLPAAGRNPLTRQEEFAFHRVRELPETGRCSGYDCENIPRNIFDYKCPDCPIDCQQVQPRHLQQQQQWQQQQQQQQQWQQQQQQQQQWQRQQQHQQRTPTTPHQPQHPDMHHPHGPSNQWPHPQGGPCQSQGYNNIHQQHEPASVHANIAPAIPAQTSVAPMHHGHLPHTGDQKRPTIPMSNCQPLSCFGDPCACRAPEVALWGESPFDVSTCAWTQGRRTASMRVPDPQVVRPHDKSLPEDTRPTGHPYFTHGAQTCPPHETPIAKGSGFNFDQWLATTRDREPPRHLRYKCISSLCTLCGPVTVECCPGYQIPQNYMLAKMV